MTTCRYAASNQPRIIPDRHADDCGGYGCDGCQPCDRAHCRVCGIAHSVGTCAECMAETRDALHEIGRMCDALPAEVEHRGVEGEAMMLLGPAADPEARAHVEAAYMSGRLPEGWIEAAHGPHCPLLANEACTGCAGGELHPFTVLGTWDMLWRDALEHDEAGRLTIGEAIRYLDRQMTYMAGFEHVPFEDFARDLRRCRTHLEAVLHDGEQVDRGAPCMDCRVPLVREWGADPSQDGWRCPRCRRWHTEDQYRFAVMHNYREQSDRLTAEQMRLQYGIPEGTLRRWASQRGADGRSLVRKRGTDGLGRMLYDVGDVKRLREMSA